MKVFCLLIFTLFLSGCVVYPARHVSEPRYEVWISGDEFEIVRITSALDAKTGTCEGGKVLSLVADRFVSEPEYGWLKAAYFVPVDSYKPIKICAVGAGGNTYYWEENIGVFGSEYPKLWKFQCKVVNERLSCKKITQVIN
ncbi:hypothetical protein [Teredinibacter purpureus]|uniref:hypothetical protein n=1 Tax=Teredinibacter purpureus TaxID=2731756 RepID=UPI0005F84CA3|nr:hypothetical protein [Teredinibacter purpureus]